ncbi:(2Fe-2S)-binding protein [Tundrisphaera lichenicola]|uniref:(2Fe-2S)-binding protein n=1 Tax=Tundrisphaera lichenicola TaxID=2029860 RepID=UPI003EC08868
MKAADIATLKFTVNGTPRTIRTDPDRPLLDVLREDLQLTGTKYGCGMGQCGACSVLLDGKRVFSCRTPASRAEGASVRTIEGLASGDELHPVQRAFLEEGAFQCGYCTPGMIMAAVALLEANPGATRSEISEGMNRNICRCCSYPGILDAVCRASKPEGE